MTPETHDLIDLRLAQSGDCIAEARQALADGNRLFAMHTIYHAMLFSACALLASRQFTPAGEGGIPERFHREFVASGLFPQEVAAHFKRATDIHHGLDAHSQPPPDTDRLKQLITDAETFLTATKLFLGK